MASRAATPVPSARSILGFFGVIVALVCASGATVIGLLARDAGLHHLILPVLGFCGVVIIAILIGVAIAAWKDPAALMLGEVSGEVFLESRKLLQGDSTGGEYIEDIRERINEAGLAAKVEEADEAN